MPGQVAFLGVSLVHLIKSPNLANGYIYILYIYIIYVLYILYIYILYVIYIKFGGLGLSFRFFSIYQPA